MRNIDGITTASRPKKLNRRQKIHNKFTRLTVPNLLAILAAILLIIFLSGLVGWQLGRPTQANNSDPENVIKNVGQLVELPANETPNVATVVDRTKIANQPFLAQAQNGDKLLIYTTAKKIIIYRPKDNKIIDIGPVSLSSSELNSAGK